MGVISPCMTWVPILWKQLLGSINKNKNPLPNIATIDAPLTIHQAVDELVPSLSAVDDPPPKFLENDEPLLSNLPYHIILDILSRLPAICVFRCQRVSRPLYVLTTTPFFTRLHNNRATSVIVLQPLTHSICYRFVNVFFMEEGIEKLEAKSMKMDLCYMCKNDSIVLLGSYDGFLMFRNKFMSQPIFLIWNPITNKQVTLTSRSSYLYVCGFYFHPLRKEYEVLFLFVNGMRFQFQILTLGTKSWRRTGKCSYPPSCERPPVIINGTLYWMVDLFRYYRANHVYPSESRSIVSFRIETEEFSTLEPGGRLGEIYHREKIHLSELEGQLCLCDPMTCSKLILWILNHSTMLWVERHILILPRLDVHQRFSLWPNHFRTEVVHIKKCELLVRHSNTLLLYNLYLGTVKKMKGYGFENDSYRAIVHTHNMSSLHCDRVISLQRPSVVRNTPRKCDNK